jgi:hypothetical protein
MPAEDYVPSLYQVPQYAEQLSRDMYPAQKGQYDQQDAARHMLAAATLARKYGLAPAEFLGRMHENMTSPWQYAKSLFGGKMPNDYEQDLYNNALGARAGVNATNQEDLATLINRMAEQATPTRTEGRPWIGRPTPVKKADGGLMQYKECSCHG